MNRYILTLFLAAVALTLNAQSWDEIKSQRNVYLFGEGRAETIEDADALALKDLISQISIQVSATVDKTEKEIITASGASVSSTFQSKLNSFSSATLNNTERMVISPDEPNVVVGRYIRKADIDSIFKGRREKVKEYVSYALEAEQKASIDNALRYYYWSFLLLNSLPSPNSVKYTTSDGKEQLLATWIPAQMNNIFDEIKAEVVKKRGNDLDVWFTYKGKPVSSLDYTFFDGRNYSSIYQVRDGRGVVELPPGISFEQLKFKYEYKYESQAKLQDKEVAAAMTATKGPAFAKATKITRLEKQEDFDHSSKTTQSTVSSAGTEVHVPVVSKAVHPNTKHLCEASLKSVLSAISSKNYESVENCFTVDGYDVFLRLIKYGNARILAHGECEYSKLDDQIVARSIPMSFQFKTGAVKSFVENVVFTFNDKGKIDNITFGLGEVATNDIMAQKSWKEEVRMMIINFLEVYKTAFALKRLDYIESIFDDNAVIISGRVVFKNKGTDVDKYAQHKYVIKTQYTKGEYLKHLKASFGSKEYINVRFANTLVKKANGKEVYGIQLRQDYFSSNYGDQGYLYLQVDMTDPNKPIIKVRTWQEEIDPTVGRPYGMEDF